MNDLKPTGIESLRVYLVAVDLPLLQSRVRPDLSLRDTVWHGTKVVVQKTIVLTSMKPPNHVRRIERPVNQEVAPQIDLVLPNRRVKERKFASSGNKGDVTGVLSVNSCTRVPLENQGRLLLRVLRAVIPKERRSLPGARSARTPEAQVDQRVRRTQDRRNPKGRHRVPRRLPLLSVW